MKRRVLRVIIDRIDLFRRLCDFVPGSLRISFSRTLGKMND